MPTNRIRRNGTAIANRNSLRRRSHLPNVMNGRNIIAAGMPNRNPPKCAQLSIQGSVPMKSERMIIMLSLNNSRTGCCGEGEADAGVAGGICMRWACN